MVNLKINICLIKKNVHLLVIKVHFKALIPPGLLREEYTADGRL